MSSPVARSASWSTACTARPMAVPYRPRCHGGRSRSTGSLASPASLSGELGVGVVGRSGGEQRRQPGGADRGPHRRLTDRAGALGRPLAGVGPRQFRLGRRRARHRFGPLRQHPRPVAVRAGLRQHGGARGGGGAVGGRLRLAVQRDDEVVDGPGARHVQQAPALGVAHLLVERLELLEQLALAVGERPPGCSAARRGSAPPRPWGRNQTTDIAVRRRIWVVSPARIVIGNSRPLAACTVMMRTASWSRSGRIVSLARPSPAWNAAHRR